MIRAEALALVEAAERDAKRGTPGPWTVGRVPGAHQNDAAPYMVHDESEKQVADCYDNTSWSPRDCGDNAQLIVAMRSREPQLAAALREALAEAERLETKLNTPHVADFVEAVRVEAAHQIERWGVEHDAGKRPEDWIALVAYLLGKATKAHYDDDRDKLLHHVITIASACANWHASAAGIDMRMRPGIGPSEVDSLRATIAELKLRIPDVATERELALLRCVVDAIDDASSYDELSSIKVTTPDGGRHYLAYATEQARAARRKP